MTSSFSTIPFSCVDGVPQLATTKVGRVVSITSDGRVWVDFVGNDGGPAVAQLALASDVALCESSRGLLVVDGGSTLTSLL